MKESFPDIGPFLKGRLKPNGGLGVDEGAFPKISIVIPCLNQGRFLERTILSILNQNYPNTELIVIDGGSTDNTVSVIQKYENEIAFWASEPDEGQADALNKGLARSTGEIFGWQNSDDIFLPDAFEKVVRIFSAYPEVVICYGNWCSINEEDRITDLHYALNPRRPKAPFENMDAYNQSMFWRRTVCDFCGGFDKSLHKLLDNDFIIRSINAAGLNGIYRIDAFLGGFRRHGAQKSDFMKMDDAQEREERYLENKFGFAPSDSATGKCYRLRYRWAQLLESLRRGGPAYTLRKFRITYRRRGRFI